MSARSKRSSKASSKRSSKASSIADSVKESAMPGSDTKGKARQVDSLLLVFIHGFKGSETTTFADFPQHLTKSLQESYEHLAVRPVIYPTYETRGSLAKAVEAFVDWLTTTCVEMECADLMLADADADESSLSSSSANGPRSGGAGSVKIVLCGHSMGGLVAVDAALEIANSSLGRKREGKLWPRICGVVAFDTPVSNVLDAVAMQRGQGATWLTNKRAFVQYCGVHPRVFKNTANKYHGYYTTARSTAEQLTPIVAPVGAALASWFSKGQGNGQARESGHQQQQTSQQRSASSLWSKTLLATGALALAGGAAAGTYYGGGWQYMSDHFLFVSNLWDNSAQRTRLDSLIGLPQVFFHALYNRLPPLDKGQPPRLFIVMPPADSGSGKTAESFEAVDNHTASDEIDAHTTMFYTSNSSYEALTRRATALIVRCLDNEARYGDQVHSQNQGDLEHGDSDDTAYPANQEIPLDAHAAAPN